MAIALISLLALLVYIYLGYPALLWLTAPGSAARKTVPNANADRTVSLIIAARNEEKSMERKVNNMREWDFPADRLQVILVSDGSEDRTVEAFESAMESWYAEGPAPAYTIVALARQKGKSLAQNEGAARARHDLLVFSDAEAQFEKSALTRLANAFDDPRVACATGKAIYRNADQPGAAFSEGAYFHYESWIRSLESRAGLLTMGSGCILAIRRALFEPLQSTEGEDWALCLRSVEAGHRVIQVDDAIAYETAAASSEGLFRTKVRIISKDFRTLWQKRHLLNPLAHGKVAWVLLSHKELRWFTFLWMGLALVLNALLLKEGPGWSLLFLAQLAFYSAAMLGAMRELRSGNAHGAAKDRWMSIPYNFCVIQTAAALGIWKAFTGRSENRWQPIREGR